MNIKTDWMSCRKFTIKVSYYMDGTIKDTAPIAKKFIGQPIRNLVKWMKKFGDFRYKHIS